MARQVVDVPVITGFYGVLAGPWRRVWGLSLTARMLYISTIVSVHPPTLSPSGLSALKLLRAVGKAEGASFLILLGLGMPLKYLGNVLIAGKIAGWLHGALFVILLVALGRARYLAQLPIRNCGWVFLGSLLPFGPFVVDRQLQAYVSSANAPQASGAD